MINLLIIYCTPLDSIPSGKYHEFHSCRAHLHRDHHPPVRSDFTGQEVDQPSYRGRDVVLVSHAPKDSLWWNRSNVFLQFPGLSFLALDSCFFGGSKIKGNDVVLTRAWRWPTDQHAWRIHPCIFGDFCEGFICQELPTISKLSPASD